MADAPERLPLPVEGGSEVEGGLGVNHVLPFFFLSSLLPFFFLILFPSNGYLKNIVIA